MKFVEVRPALSSDLERICNDLNLSEDDTKIMFKWYHHSSEVWAGFYKGKLACLYGVYSESFLSDIAYLWLTTNDLVKEHPFLFVRHSQIIVRKLLESHTTIIGHVSAGAPNSIQWLQWLGVKLGETENGLISFKLKRSG